jgi:hypothetical protein
MIEYLLGVSIVVNVSFLYLFYRADRRIEAAHWSAAMAHRRITRIAQSVSDDGK